MTSGKHLPFTILCLILFAAGLILVGGWRFARIEVLEPVEQDQASLTAFASEFLGELRDLESIYTNHLKDIRAVANRRPSEIELASVSRNVVGIEQVSVMRDSVVCLDVRSLFKSDPLPVPCYTHERDSADVGALLVDRRWISSAGQWVAQPGLPPHYVTRVNGDGILVIRINPDAVADVIDEWLASWLPEVFEPVEVSGIIASVVSPSGASLIPVGNEAKQKPSLLLPVQSRFGRWNIATWNQYQSIVTWRMPVLVASAALALFLALAGLFGFIQLRNAMRKAEQRVSFVNRVSHELRSPMTNILLNLDLLSGAVSQQHTRAEKSLQLVREETCRLSRLLANVLTFSSRGREKNPPASVSCDMASIADEVLGQFRPLLARKNIRVEVQVDLPDSCFAIGSPDAIHQILGNLISNVEKYGPADSTCTVEVSRCDDRGIILAVTDQGPGIAIAAQHRIFKPFVRLSDSTAEGVSGTGLGLAIARDLASQMNGELAVQSPLPGLDRGTRFELVLPESRTRIVSIAS